MDDDAKEIGAILGELGRKYKNLSRELWIYFILPKQERKSVRLSVTFIKN